MSKRDILRSLFIGSADKKAENFRRFLLEDLKTREWKEMVCDIASWLNHDNVSDVEEALIDFLANDELTRQQIV